MTRIKALNSLLLFKDLKNPKLIWKKKQEKEKNKKASRQLLVFSEESKMHVN